MKRVFSEYNGRRRGQKGDLKSILAPGEQTGGEQGQRQGVQLGAGTTIQIIYDGK